MDYFNKDSIAATQRSYNEALDKLLTLCPNVEPSANEYNSRSVSPTSWRPLFGFKRDALLRHANYVTTRYEKLFDFGIPKVIPNTYTIWRERWFIVYCAITFPFTIYGWEHAHEEYPQGYDDHDNPIGKTITIPAKMTEWCSPQYLTLEVYDGVWDKAWGLKDWYIKYDEVMGFGKMFDNAETQAQYAKGVFEANTEVKNWELAISKIHCAIIPTNSKED
jgi:alpha-N-acetylglucosamine transferase